MGAGWMVSPVLPQICCGLSLWYLGVPPAPDRNGYTDEGHGRGFRARTSVGDREAASGQRHRQSRSAAVPHRDVWSGLLRDLFVTGAFRTVLALTPDGARDRLPVPWSA